MEPGVPSPARVRRRVRKGGTCGAVTRGAAQARPDAARRGSAETHLALAAVDRPDRRLGQPRVRRLVLVVRAVRAAGAADARGPDRTGHHGRSAQPRGARPRNTPRLRVRLFRRRRGRPCARPLAIRAARPPARHPGPHVRRRSALACGGGREGCRGTIPGGVRLASYGARACRAGRAQLRPVPLPACHRPRPPARRPRSDRPRGRVRPAPTDGTASPAYPQSSRYRPTAAETAEKPRKRRPRGLIPRFTPCVGGAIVTLEPDTNALPIAPGGDPMKRSFRRKTRMVLLIILSFAAMC